ncbi:MAG: radical SAM protein [Candidatus Woesearchaeota archaeon]
MMGERSIITGMKGRGNRKGLFDKQKWLFVKANVMPAFRRLLLDRPGPMFVGLFLTRRCNLECSYCFSRKNIKDPSLDEVKKRVDKIKEIGCNIIYFMGGEPTLRKDIVEITRYCNDKGMFIVMNTNGRLLNKKMIDELSEAGMNSMVVSLDGVKKLKQSRKTLFDNPHLLSLLEHASCQEGMSITINTVLTGENTKDVIPLLIKASEHGLMMTTCLQTQPPSTFVDKGLNTRFSDEDAKKIHKLLDGLIEKRGEGYPLFEPIYCYKRMKEFLKGKYNWNCKAGRHFFSVDCDGSVSLCPETKTLGIHISDIDKSYYQKYKRLFEKQLKKCNKACVENYALCHSYYDDHKLRFLFNK